jgi:hypothetical protein
MMAGKLYYLSKKKNTSLKLVPRLPNNFMTRKGYEDNKTPRVCMSNSIDGALMALSRKLDGQTIYVYEPMVKSFKTVSNRTIVSKKLVPDARITGETWAMEPVKMRLIGVVKVGKAIDKPHPYIYGDKTANLYKWRWTWKKKIEQKK